ncbi:hypothetical protein GCM10011521_20230 [Arenimonas soli]|uniref:AB hydrolase-1 domain-containing protein n=1 Tax=Arenimonas soli TaxID=2269504 RepID=A0ABQ1HL36_9GAMM|nr:alpha/beta fold hydrolase [Arenimonas soli]GGA81848.1 hypothetical protein GCM10011521_20230 [Arenimonas soli]
MTASLPSTCDTPQTETGRQGPRLGRWLCDWAARREQRRAGLSSRTLVAGGTVLHVLDGGAVAADAEAFVLLHGFSGEARVWTRFARYLAPNFRIIIPDLAGHGDSDFDSQLDYSIPAHAERVLALLDELGIARAHVAGNSMGGSIAAWIAAYRPERVATLTLISPAGLRAPSRSAFDQQLERGENPFLIEDRHAFDAFYAQIMARPPYTPGPVRDWIAHDFRERRERIARMFRDFVTSPDPTPVLSKISAPTLILWGGRDRIVDPSAASLWCHGITGSRTEVWPWLGHMPMLEDPRSTANCVAGFVAEPRATPAETHGPALVETTLEGLGGCVHRLLRGEVRAVLVKSAMPREACDRVWRNFSSSGGLYRRSDGVSGEMVGTNAFLKSSGEIIDDYLQNNAHAEALFQGVPNLYRQLFDCIEDAGYRFRNAYVDGVPAPTHRGTVWNDIADDSLVLKAHTDWPQVTNSGLEYSDVEHPIAVNFYPRHPSGGASRVRLYDFVPSAQWLAERGILRSGYPIEQAELEGIDYVDIAPEAGDLLLFAAANVHAVFNASRVDDVRLNVNGFIGLSQASGRVLAWA